MPPCGPSIRHDAAEQLGAQAEGVRTIPNEKTTTQDVRLLTKGWCSRFLSARRPKQEPQSVLSAVELTVPLRDSVTDFVRMVFLQIMDFIPQVDRGQV